MTLGLHLTGFAPMVLYIAGIAVFLVSVFWRPEIGIYYIVPLLPLQTTRYKLHGFPLGAQWIDFILLGVLIGAWRKGYSVFTRNPLSRLLLILSVLTYISLWRGALYLNRPMPIWFDDLRMSDWKNYMVIFLVFFLALASIRDSKQMRILLFLMCVSMLMLNRTYINTATARDFSAFSYEIRDEGPMGYAGANGLAALEAQFSAFLLGLYALEGRALPKLGYIIVLGTCLVSLMYTLSRGGYVAVLLAALFVGIVKSRKLVIVVALFLFTWQMIVPNAVRERVFMTEDSNGQLDHSAAVRLTLWDNALEILRGDPVFGTGFDTYKFLHAVGPYEDTHNYYVKVALETGVLGFVIFLGLLTKMFLSGYRLFRARAGDSFSQGLGLGLAGMIVATAVANLFGDRWTYIEETGFMWVILAMVIRYQMTLDELPVGRPDNVEQPTCEETSEVL